jgi:hypothetical protein
VKKLFIFFTVFYFLHRFSVARWRFSPPDLENSGGFESHLAGKKYISGGLPISGGFLADLTNFTWVFVFVWQILAGLESLLAKNKLFFSLFLPYKK